MDKLEYENELFKQVTHNMKNAPSPDNADTLLPTGREIDNLIN